MRVTTWAEYGLIVSLHLAKQGREAPTPARDMAKKEGLPADYVEQILLKLRRAGLVSSVRGAKGGYYLAREPDTISVRDVIEAAENRTFEVNCDVHKVSAVRCHDGNPCSIRPVWRELQRRVDDMLSSISLGDLMLEESEVQELVAV
ncbi:MAG: Rrf2 family transcriptional regulator [Gemmatimonadales bacterium]|jgi:Rrf2 family protein